MPEMNKVVMLMIFLLFLANPYIQSLIGGYLEEAQLPPLPTHSSLFDLPWFLYNKKVVLLMFALKNWEGMSEPMGVLFIFMAGPILDPGELFEIQEKWIIGWSDPPINYTQSFTNIWESMGEFLSSIHTKTEIDVSHVNPSIGVINPYKIGIYVTTVDEKNPAPVDR